MIVAAAAAAGGFVTPSAQIRDGRALFRHTSPGRLAGMPSRALAELLAVVVPPACVACRDALPRAELWLCASCTQRAAVAAGARLPALRPRRPPPGLPGGGRGVRPRLGAARARRRGARAGRRAQVPRRPARGRADGGAHGRQPAGVLRAGAARRARAGPVAGRAGAPAGVRSRRRPGGRARATARPPVWRCLRRRDRAERQVGSSRRQRRRAGGWRSSCARHHRSRALLVDDVHTTGATLDACARALVAGGCGEVVAVTYTRTL